MRPWRVAVSGHSMEPTLREGDWVLVLPQRRPRPGDVVLVRDPRERSRLLLKRVAQTTPDGCLVNAQAPAAVVAGNTETSSRIVDVVFRAFGEAMPVPAQGQGTMNNVALGNDRFTYYETIGGGQGASAAGPGPSGVHVGMSNTLNTPIEALELEYPLRVERYELAYGSGGEGANRGGDGIERSVRVLEDAATTRRARRAESRDDAERTASTTPSYHPRPAAT